MKKGLLIVLTLMLLTPMMVLAQNEEAGTGSKSESLQSAKEDVVSEKSGYSVMLSSYNELKTKTSSELEQNKGEITELKIQVQASFQEMVQLTAEERNMYQEEIQALKGEMKSIQKSALAVKGAARGDQLAIRDCDIEVVAEPTVEVSSDDLETILDDLILDTEE